MMTKSTAEPSNHLRCNLKSGVQSEVPLFMRTEASRVEFIRYSSIWKHTRPKWDEFRLMHLCLTILLPQLFYHRAVQTFVCANVKVTLTAWKVLALLEPRTCVYYQLPQDVLPIRGAETQWKGSVSAGIF